MKKLMVIAVAMLMVFGATTVFAANEEAVKTGIGSLTLSGAVKAGFNYYIGNEQLGTITTDPNNTPDDTSDDVTVTKAVDRGTDMEFVMNFVSLGFKGWVLDERIQYYIALSGTTQAVSVCDAWMSFNYIPYTAIRVGYQLPSMTYWNNLPTTQMQTIDSPLMNRTIFTRERQTGLAFLLGTKYIDAHLGFFNGRSYNVYFATPVNANAAVGNGTFSGDQNNGKDIHLGVIGKPPVDGLKMHAHLWYGTPEDFEEVEDGEITEHNATVIMINVGADYMAPFGLTAIFDFLYAMYNWEDAYVNAGGDDVDRADDTYEFTAMSYYLQVGYNFGPVFEVPVEIILRYDYLDPDTMNDEEKHGDKDALTDIVGGVNYYIKGYNAMLSLNYIYHGEEWEEVGNLAGDDTQDGISNDELKLQAQIAF